jgi:hypothetical protein
MNDRHSETILKGISDRLDAILAVLVVGLPSERASKEPQIAQLLANCGLTHASIARVLGKNADAVRMVLSRARKKK